MNGKVLKISNNDLYGNVDDREIVLFVAFNHLKYMNKYAIFCFKDAFNKNKLCYGSIHLKDKSIVIFSIDDNTYVDKFVKQYIDNELNTKEFEIIDIDNINKVELISYSEMDFDKLDILEKLSIKRNDNTNVDEIEKKKPAFLYFLLFMMIILLIGITYLYFNPTAFQVKLNKLSCKMDGYDQKIELNYSSNIDMNFNKENKLKNIQRVDVYTFNEAESYNDFKDNNRQNEYFNINGGYKYDDDKLQLRIIYNDKLIIDNYNEILEYYKNEGYSCIEDVYYE